MNDIDRLATAMGYIKISNYTGSFADKQGTEHWTHPEGYPVFEAPDPFTDANDDYVVLEWVRKTWQPLSVLNDKAYEFAKLLSEPASYQIGDYARAALKVLK